MSGSTFCWSTKQTCIKIHMCSYWVVYLLFTLTIYILPFLLFITKTTACRDYFYFTYYTRGYFDIQVIPAPKIIFWNSSYLTYESEMTSNLVTYYTRRLVGIQVITAPSIIFWNSSYLIWDYFYPTNLLLSGTCGYPSDTRPLNNVQKFTNIINLSVSVHLSGHIAVTAAPHFFYSAGNLPITRRFWPAWTCTFSAAFL